MRPLAAVSFLLLLLACPVLSVRVTYVFIENKSDAELRDAVLHSNRVDPHLPKHIAALADRARENDQLIGDVSDEDLFLLYDRVHSLKLSRKETASVLKSCSFLSKRADEIFRGIDDRCKLDELFCCYNLGSFVWEVSDKRRQVWADFLFEVAKDIDTVEEVDMIKAFVENGLAARLYDRKLLFALAGVGIRLNLVTVLYSTKIAPADLAAVFPLYLSYWPLEGQIFNWNFLHDMRMLRLPESKTTVEEFWAIPQIADHFRDRTGDIIPALREHHGLRLRRRFALLDDIRYPEWEAILQDPVDLVAISIAVDDFDLLGAIYNKILPKKLDMTELLYDGAIEPHTLRWSDFEAFKIRHRNLLRLILRYAPDMIWTRVAIEILEGSYNDVVTLDVLKEALAAIIPEFEPQLRNADPIVDVDAADLLRADGVRGSSVADLVMNVGYVKLGKVVNVRNKSDGNTLLHFAILNELDLVLDKLLGVKEVDVTVVNNAGMIPFDYIAAWRNGGDRVSRPCTEIIALNEDNLADLFEGWTRSEPAAQLPVADDLPSSSAA